MEQAVSTTVKDGHSGQLAAAHAQATRQRDLRGAWGSAMVNFD